MFVLDVDPGIDDAVALFLMDRLVDERRVIVTTFGNAALEVTHRNLMGLREAFGCSCPVVKGCSRPLSGKRPPFDFYHGPDALGGLSALLPPGDGEALPLSTLASLVRPDEKVVYCAVGPLTNLASLIRDDDPVVSKIERVFSMGGGLKAFNSPHFSEFNFHADPEAVAVVFGSGLDVTIAPFDLGMGATLTSDDIEWVKAGSRCRIMDRMLDRSLETARAHDREHSDIHDGFPVLYHLHPDAFETARTRLSVDEWGALRESDDGFAVTVLSGLRDKDIFPRTLRCCMARDA